jgi:hypothetical protein
MRLVILNRNPSKLMQSNATVINKIIFFERKPWGNTPRQQEKYIKKRRQSYKKRDLHPAQPEIRQRKGTKQRKKQQKRLQEVGREGRGQLSNTATNYRALSHSLIDA